MRLLNTSSIQVEEFSQRDIPEYVILSHTWLEEEITLQDLQDSSRKATEKKGYAKLKNCCDKAASDGYYYCWIDTCCIDKTSSAELSEAINSMYQYYKNSSICYVYLSDFDGTSETIMENYRAFTSSRWWTRGWTLQELIAPDIVEFYSRDWIEVGTKLSLQEQITEITGIDEKVLRGADPLRRNVAVRLSWAARRQTTRIEDRAYCLMGLFGVNMPLLYGEGNRAFLRLQEEIMRAREDYTLFTWCPEVRWSHRDPTLSKGLLADSPADFVESRDNLTLRTLSRANPSNAGNWTYRDLARNSVTLFEEPKDHQLPYLTSRGLRISLPMLERNSGEFYGCITLLNASDSAAQIVCVILHRLSPKSDRYVRRAGTDITLLPKTSSKGFKYKSIYVLQGAPAPLNVPTKPLGTACGAIVLVNWKYTGSQPFQCYLSSWINMNNFLHERFRDVHGSTPSGPSLRVNEDGGVQRHRMNKLVNSLIGLDYGRTLSLALSTPPDQCWFTDMDSVRDKGNVGIRGVLGFANEKDPNGAFLVQLRLFEERPLCSIALTTLDALQKPELRKVAMQEAQMATHQSDRNSLCISTGSSSQAEVSVSIRRLASASAGIRRFMLTIALKNVLPPVFTVPSMSSYDSINLNTNGLICGPDYCSSNPQ